MLKKTRGLFVSLAMLALTTGPAFAQPAVTVGTVGDVDPGASVQVSVDITGATAAAGVNWKITYDANTVDGDVTAADGTGLGNHTLTSNALAGDNRGVVYNTTQTEAFAADGQIAVLTVKVPGTAGNGDVIPLSFDTNYDDDGIASAISDINGDTLGSFVDGQITVSTPYPMAVSDFQSNGWTSNDNPAAGPPWSFNSISTSYTAGGDLVIHNTNPSNDPTTDGYRAHGYWESPEDLVPFYNEDTLVMMKYTVVSNKAEAYPGANTRFRATLIAGDINTLSTLPEYHVYQAFPRPDESPASVTTPTSTPRDYRFFWSTDDVAPTRNYKRMAWDIIAFEEGLPTDLTYTLTDFEAKRYDLPAVEAAASEIVAKVDFSAFTVDDTDQDVGPIFPDGAAPYTTWNRPGMAINNAGDLDNQEIVYSWLGGTGRPGNDQVVAWIDTGSYIPFVGGGGTLSSHFTDVTVAEDSLYIADFYVEAVGAGMADRSSQPGHRYRVNCWQTGESWTVTTQSHGTAVSIAASGDAEWTKIRLYFMTNGDLPDGSTDPVALAFDANNFVGFGASDNAGDYKLRRIRIQSVSDFFSQATAQGWELD